LGRWNFTIKFEIWNFRPSDNEMEYSNTVYVFSEFSFCYCMPRSCEVRCLQIQIYCSKASELTSLKSNSMKQISSWECSAIQEISHILWNPKVHCHVHKIPQLSTLLSQMNSVHILTRCFFNIHFNIVTYLVTRHDVWVGNWIYGTLKTRNY
jgi:hypothetical protein